MIWEEDLTEGTFLQTDIGVYRIGQMWPSIGGQTNRSFSVISLITHQESIVRIDGIWNASGLKLITEKEVPLALLGRTG